MGEHVLEVFAESETVLGGAELEPPCTSGRSSRRSTRCRRRPRSSARPGPSDLSSTDLRVHRHRQPDAGVPAHVRVPGHQRRPRCRTRTTGSPASARSTCSTSYTLRGPAAVGVGTSSRSTCARSTSPIRSSRTRSSRASRATPIRRPHRSHVDAGARHARAVDDDLRRAGERRRRRLSSRSRSSSSASTTRRRRSSSSSSASSSSRRWTSGRRRSTGSRARRRSPPEA